MKKVPIEYLTKETPLSAVVDVATRMVRPTEVDQDSLVSISMFMLVVANNYVCTIAACMHERQGEQVVLSSSHEVCVLFHWCVLFHH